MLTFWLQVRRILKVFVSILKDKETRGIFYLTLFTICCGTMFYTKVEGFSVIDGIYFSFTTLTTIGYGDIAPVTPIGKIFTILYAIWGLGIMGIFISVFVKKYIDNAKNKLKK